MTVGESIKIHRIRSGFTQKEMSEKLNVTFQTISKWENDTNEPDLSTLKQMCDIFGCTIDELINPKENDKPVSDNNVETEIQASPVAAQIQISTCRDCGKPIFSGEPFHHVEKISPSGVKETIDICESCYNERETKNRQRLEAAKEAARMEKENIETAKRRRQIANKKTLMIWSIVAGVAVFIAVLVVCIVFFKYVGVAGVILLPLLGGYGIFSCVYCVFSDNWITELFLDIASFSIKMPGVIFSFDADGLKFLIAMKILFWILGIVIMLGAIAVAIAICATLSMFAFPFIVNK